MGWFVWSDERMCTHVLAPKNPQTVEQAIRACDRWVTAKVYFWKNSNRIACHRVAITYAQFVSRDWVPVPCSEIENEFPTQVKYTRSPTVQPEPPSDVNYNAPAGPLQKPFAYHEMIGIEDELVGSRACRVLPGSTTSLRIGPVRYADVIAQTAYATTGTNVAFLSVTVDGVNVVQRIAKKGHIPAIARRFGIDEAAFKKDSVGLGGLIEIVSGPVSPDLVSGMLEAVNKLYQLLRTKYGRTGGPVFKETETLLDLGGRATPFSMVVDEYNAWVDDHPEKYDPKHYKLKLMVPRDVKLAPYKFYVLNRPTEGYRQSVQLNFGVLLKTYTTKELLPMFHTEFRADALEACIAGAAAYAKTLPTGVGTNDVQATLSLLAYTAWGAAVGALKSKLHPGTPLTAAKRKNIYELLPKVNVPDIVRCMDKPTRVAVFKWARKVGGDGIGAGLHAETTRLLADPFAKQASKLRGDATFADEMLRLLKRFADLVFSPHTACAARYVGETPTAYGSDVKYDERVSCWVSGLSRVLPVYRSRYGLSVVVEGRYATGDLNAGFVPPGDKSKMRVLLDYYQKHQSEWT